MLITVAAALFLSGAPLHGKDAAPALSTATSALHEGEAFGHGDSSVAQVLKSSHATEHFVFHFSGDKAALDGFFRTLEDNYSRITKALGTTLTERVEVEVYPDIKLYHRRTFGENTPDWAVGNFDPDNKVIRMVSPNNPGSMHNYKSVVGAGVHEFTHCVTFAARQGAKGDMPVWLNEGVSLYYASPSGPRNTKAIMKASAAGLIPGLADLEADFLKHNGYVWAHVIVDYMVKRYGEKKLVELVKEPAAFERIFSVTKGAFDSAWQRDTIKKYSKPA